MSAPGRNRTCDLALRRHSLYPLSYRGKDRPESNRPPKGGGGEGDRTLDLRIANATLSQLSYSPKKGPEYYQQSRSKPKSPHSAANLARI